MAPSFSDCGDFYLEALKRYLPPTCDDAFYLNPGKKGVLDVTDKDVEEHHDNNLTATTHSRPERTTRSLSTTIRSSSHRRPQNYTQSPEALQRSFQLLVRTNTNRFNQRLSMLEGNTLDMKESLEKMKRQHSHFSSQLKTLVRVLSPPNRTDRINELAKNYTNIEVRQSQLERKLEILIDGFTALAQEIDKVKRSRPTQNRKVPGTAATLITSLTTTLMNRTSTWRPQGKVVVPKTIPAPHTVSTNKKDKSSTKQIQPIQEIKSRRTDVKTHFTLKADREQYNKSLKRATVPNSFINVTSDSRSNRSRTTSVGSNKTHHSQQKRKTSSSKNPLVSQNKPNVMSVKHGNNSARENGTSIKSKKSVNVTRKHDQPSRSLTRLQGKDKSTSKFQIPPPAHTKIHQMKPSLNSSKSYSKPQKQEHISSKKSHKPKTIPSKQNTNILPTRKPSHVVQMKRRHNKLRPSRTNQLNLTSNEDQETARGTSASQPEKEFTYTTASSKPTNKINVRPPKHKGKITTPRKSPQKKTSKSFNILDILMQNKKGLKQDGNFHIVVGRLAIPIKILPDY